MTKKKKIGLVAGLSIVIIILVGCIIFVIWLVSSIGKAVSSSITSSTADSPIAKPVPTPTPNPEKIKADFKASATQITVSEIAKDPNYWKQLPITFNAKIINFVQDSQGNTVAANVSDPNDYSSIIQLQFSILLDISQVNKGDLVTVWGMGLGSFSGQNSYGASINEGAAKESYLKDLTNGYVNEVNLSPNL